MRKLVRGGTYAATAVISLILGFWLSSKVPISGITVVGLMFGGFIGFIISGLLTPAAETLKFRLPPLALCMFCLGLTVQGFYLIGHH